MARKKAKKKKQSRGKLEWIVSIASTLLVLAVLGYLAWGGLRSRQPPSFRTALDSTWTANDTHYLSAVVRNTGDYAVEQVLVGVELLSADSSVAETEVTLDWLPAHSRRTVVALFQRDPRRYRAHVEVRGYVVP